MLTENSFHILRQVVSVNRGRNSILLRCRTDKKKNVNFRIDICTDKILRFRMFLQEMKENEKFPLIVKKIWPETEFKLIGDKEKIEITTKKLIVRVVRNPWQFCVLNKKRVPIWEENPLDLNVREEPIVTTLGFYKSKNVIQKVIDAFSISPQEHFYGFGEKFIPIDKRGQKIILWNTDALGVGTEKSYKNVPFFMSSKGFGIFINTTCKVVSYVGDPSKSSNSFVIEINDSRLDYYLIYGPSFKDILNQYTEITGKSPVPPKWSFGIWMSRCYYESRKVVEKVADELREKGIPCDVINFDGYWMRDGMICDFIWDEERFSDPEKMIYKLKKKGFKICLWEYPYVSVKSKMYKEGEKRGFFLTKKDGSVYQINSGAVAASHTKKGFKGQGMIGSFGSLPKAPPVGIVDFSNPEALRWYQEKHKPLLQMGVDVFKTDFGEEIPEDSYSYSGINGKEMHNLYSLLYNKTVFEITKSIKGKGLVWGRSLWAGSQKYPVNWGGDPQANFVGMACTLRGGLSCGLSGIPFWSHDIGGFYGDKPSPKLYIRWAQFGLLSSHARCHGTTPREPWEFGEEALRIFRFYAKFRYRLIPYLYSYAYIASKTGLPVMRAMVLEYQDDPNVYDKDLQYMLGKELLVAPIFDESNERYVYLPEGKWIDYWTGDIYEGPYNLFYKAPINIIPLFVKAGAIIPMGPKMNYVGERKFIPITLNIYPYRNSEFTLYDDEESTLFKCSQRRREIVLKINEEKGNCDKPYIIKFNGINKVKKVKSMEETVDQCTRKNFNKVKQGWYYDNDLSVLWVKIILRKYAILKVFLGK